MMRQTSRWSNVRAALLALAGVVALGSAGVRAADHLDGPRLMSAAAMGMGNLDINDLYLFQGGKRTDTVMVMTLSPSAGVLGPLVFNTNGRYEFHITNGVTTDDVVIFQFMFSPPTRRGSRPTSTSR